MNKNKKYSKNPKLDKTADSVSEDSKFNTKGRSNDRKGSKWDRSSRGRGRNDSSWYTPDPQLVLDAGRWPYSRPVGTPLDRNSIIHKADATDFGVPGICSVGLINTIGPCVQGQDAPNVAANAVYTYVRHANAGSRNYDANDLMIYIMAMDSVYSMISWITRIYATVGMYASMNKYLPEALAAAQNGVDLGSIRDNMANFRTRINSLILKVGSLVVPDSMPIFQRHSWLYQNYYTEGNNIKDQIYLYYPLNIYKFALDANGAGMLKNVEISDYKIGGKLTADSFVNMLEDMITPIFNDEDFNIMGGDILKAYGSNILRLVLIPDLLVAQPVLNYEVLHQFQNMHLFRTNIATATGNFDIIQDANKEYLINQVLDIGLFKHLGLTWAMDSDKDNYTKIFEIAYDELSRPLILTSDSDDVSPAENMVNTRLTAFCEIQTDNSQTGLGIRKLTYGSEIPNRICYYHYDKSWNLVELEDASLTVYDPNNTAHLQDIQSKLLIMSSFKYHPATAYVGIDASTSPITYVTSGIPCLAIDNFTTIDAEHVQSLHSVAILGEFNVPRLAVVK